MKIAFACIILGSSLEASQDRVVTLKRYNYKQSKKIPLSPEENYILSHVVRSYRLIEMVPVEHLEEIIRQYPDFCSWQFHLDENNSGLTFLHLLALQGKRADLFELLLRKGADPSITTDQGQSSYDILNNRMKVDKRFGDILARYQI